MDSDRKYRQHGYNESGVPAGNGNGNGHKPKPTGPRPPLDITGPRLPRLVQTVTASRCYNCATALPPDVDFTGACPKCSAQLHCCKQCSHFEPSTRFQCTKPIPVRIAIKDQRNECPSFSTRVTVAREMTNNQNGVPRSAAPTALTPPPRNANDARDAFARLFKK